jgi:hypothetical protein
MYKAGHCIEATDQMVKEFPELKKVRGMISAHSKDKKRQHWWCIDPNENIIDPTNYQFSHIGTDFSYFPVDESKNPTWICCNCGDVAYNYNSTCGDKCSKIMKEYYKIN